MATRAREVARTGALALAILVAVACARTVDTAPAPGADAAATAGACAGELELLVVVSRPVRLRIEEFGLNGRIQLGDVPGAGEYRFPIRDQRPMSYVATEAGTGEVLGRYSLSNTGRWRKDPPLSREVTMTRACVLPPA